MWTADGGAVWYGYMDITALNQLYVTADIETGYFHPFDVS